MRPNRSRTLAGLTAAVVGLALAAGTAPATAHPRHTDKVPVAVGHGGAVATVDADATRVGLDVLRKGGNAVDAAVAAAATLGVTEPFSAGVGGGGFFVFYEAATGRVHTIDGRETAPAAMRSDSFVEDGVAIPFAEAVTSGLSAGVPGTPATWEKALEEWGTISLPKALKGATQVARRGFVVDQTFADQITANADRFADFTSTRRLYLPRGEAPRVGSVFRNRDLARTYDLIARHGVDVLYRGPIARDIVRTVQRPPVVRGSDRVVRPGLMTLRDLRAYEAPLREPTHVTYRGLDVYGMAPPSSGGSTVGEALNILETVDLGALDETQALHHYLEASTLAFADRNRFVGDPDVIDVPLTELLSDGFAAERACLIDPAQALTKPVAPGEPDGDYAGCGTTSSAGTEVLDGQSTTHLTTATIVLEDGEPLLAVGTPGGSTIITTVLQVLVNRLDLGMDLPEAIAAPRATRRNTAAVQAEPGFPRERLTALGHVFADNPEIGAATGIELGRHGTMTAVAEPTRRGGGSAGVVKPWRPRR